MAAGWRDPITSDLFIEVPCAPDPTAGSLNCAIELRGTLSDAIRHSHLSRYDVAARMSCLLGTDITKARLDAWTAESREAWRFPFEYAAAFESAVASHCLQQLLASKRGTRVLIGEDSLLAELGRIEQQEAQLAARRKAIKDFFRGRR